MECTILCPWVGLACRIILKTKHLALHSPPRRPRDSAMGYSEKMIDYAFFFAKQLFFKKKLTWLSDQTKKGSHLGEHIVEY
jgi:hypothetical protein